ncbi:flavin reductase family protein [Salarchaeum japonicum]|uniref:Flavin reductase family protein n=1 Tax=Salarchaeum japonicum TaxID=555573 RepID=A0AAV3T4C3_9EURY|nr:flavin reductase family protein [Salarchaeum japonicum]
MEYAPDEVGSMYRTLSGAVVPRPIAWVSSTSADGVDNLAPYSFFNVVSVEPPTVMFSPLDTDERSKDTTRNVRETEEFVVNVVTGESVEAMNETSATLRADESEFEHAGVTRVESERVRPPRVAESPVNFECSLYDTLRVGDSVLVVGEVEYVHVDDALAPDGELDVRELDAVGRLAGSFYSYTRDRFSLERPP